MAEASGTEIRAPGFAQPRDDSGFSEQCVAVVAHEMRNLLAPVPYAVALLGQGDSRTTAYARKVIDRQLAQLRRLVDDLLDVVRGEHGHMSLHRSPLDLREVMAEALDVARPAIAAGRHHLTVFSPPDAPVVVNGDRCRLAQVMANLLLNAVKFTPEGGEIQLRMERGPDCATTWVRDNGIGIDADALPRIFEAYERARPEPGARDGLGLGLAIARYLVEAHGGTLRAHSAGAGKGSEFVMCLPVEHQAPSAAPASGSP